MTLLNDIQLLRDAFSHVGLQLEKDGIANCIHPEHYKYRKRKEAEISLVHFKRIFNENEIIRTANGILLEEEKHYLLEQCLSYEKTVLIYIEFLEKFIYVFSCSCSDSELFSCNRALEKMKDDVPTRSSSGRSP